MKDKVKIYDKLDKKLFKNLLFLLFLLKLTILKNELIFYTILHYQQHKKSTIFYYLYMSPLFIQRLNILHYKNFIKLY